MLLAATSVDSGGNAGRPTEAALEELCTAGMLAALELAAGRGRRELELLDAELGLAEELTLEALLLALERGPYSPPPTPLPPPPVEPPLAPPAPLLLLVLLELVTGPVVMTNVLLVSTELFHVMPSLTCWNDVLVPGAPVVK